MMQLPENINKSFSKFPQIIVVNNNTNDNDNK